MPQQAKHIHILTFWTSRLSVLWGQPWRSSHPSLRQTAGPSLRQSGRNIINVNNRETKAKYSWILTMQLLRDITEPSIPKITIQQTNITLKQVTNKPQIIAIVFCFLFSHQQRAVSSVRSTGRVSSPWLTLVWRFCMDFSKVLGGALWWLHRMATALLALLYDRILAGRFSSATSRGENWHYYDSCYRLYTILQMTHKYLQHHSGALMSSMQLLPVPTSGHTKPEYEINVFWVDCAFLDPLSLGVASWPWGLTAGELLQLLLQSDGGIVGTKHFRRQPVHQLLKVLVQNGGLERWRTERNATIKYDWWQETQNYKRISNSHTSVRVFIFPHKVQWHD